MKVILANLVRLLTMASLLCFDNFSYGMNAKNSECDVLPSSQPWIYLSLGSMGVSTLCSAMMLKNSSSNSHWLPLAGVASGVAGGIFFLLHYKDAQATSEVYKGINRQQFEQFKTKEFLYIEGEKHLINKYNSEMSNIVGNRDLVVKENADLRNAYNMLKNDVNNIVENRDLLQKESIDLISAYNILKNDVSNILGNRDLFEKENVELRSAYNILKNDINNNVRSRDLLVKENVDLRNAYNILENDMNQLVSENSTLLQSYRDLESALDHIDKEKETILLQRNELKVLNSEKDRELSILKEEVKRLSAIVPSKNKTGNVNVVEKTFKSSYTPSVTATLITNSQPDLTKYLGGKYDLPELKTVSLLEAFNAVELNSIDLFLMFHENINIGFYIKKTEREVFSFYYVSFSKINFPTEDKELYSRCKFECSKNTVNALEQNLKKRTDLFGNGEVGEFCARITKIILDYFFSTTFADIYISRDKSNKDIVRLFDRTWDRYTSFYPFENEIEAVKVFPKDKYTFQSYADYLASNSTSPRAAVASIDSNASDGSMSLEDLLTPVNTDTKNPASSSAGNTLTMSAITISDTYVSPKTDNEM